MVRTRFAPSPTGYMHIGNLRTALYAYMYARHHGGKFVLRIEDTDVDRRVDGAVELIYRSLRAAGIEYDEGPDVGGDCGPYIQSQRKSLYLPYARQLVECGGAYYCFCSRERLAELSASGATRYDKHCTHLSDAQVRQRLAEGQPYVIRQNIPPSGVSSYVDEVFGQISVDYADLEDNILIKSDGMPTYNFANVVDDHLMGITHVIRGSEYLSSTPKYNLIYDALGWQRPTYIHLQPIMRDAVHKLSKRDGDASFEDFVARGYLPQAIINYIALLGWSSKQNREKYTLAEMVELFGVSGLSKSASIFDEPKLRWLNAQYIRELDQQSFAQLILPWVRQLDYLKDMDIQLLARLLHGRAEVLGDVAPLTAFLTQFEGFDLQLLASAKQKTSLQLAGQILPEIRQCVIEGWDNLHEALSQYAGSVSLKLGAVMWIFRIAITGAASTPGGATEMAQLLGLERVLERLDCTVARLKALE